MLGAAQKGVELHVLFVCTGNICRSPTAERLALAYARQLQAADFSASSAGTRAVIGHPIHHEAARVLASLGADSSDFSAQQLRERTVVDADLVLTMTKAHRDAVLELVPSMLRRTFTLSEASALASQSEAKSVTDLAPLRPHLESGSIADIPDPIGQRAEFFTDIGSRIAKLLTPIVELSRH